MDTLDLGDERRALFPRGFALLLDTFGKPDEAQEIRRYFDTPVTDKEPADHPEVDGDLPNRSTSDVEPPLQDGHQRNSPLSGEQLNEPRD